MDIKIHEIEINGKKIKLAFTGETLYWASKSGMDWRKIAEEIADSKGEYIARLASVIEMLWLMLVDESRAEYPRPETLARLFLPIPSADVFKRLDEIILDGVKASGFKTPETR